MCYYFAQDPQKSWYDARAACQEIVGGDLVSILSDEENNFVKTNIAT